MTIADQRLPRLFISRERYTCYLYLLTVTTLKYKTPVKSFWNVPRPKFRNCEALPTKIIAYTTSVCLLQDGRCDNYTKKQWLWMERKKTECNSKTRSKPTNVCVTTIENVCAALENNCVALKLISEFTTVNAHRVKKFSKIKTNNAKHKLQ